jgi:cytochrome b pre-mRNA-processing protein 3
MLQTLRQFFRSDDTRKQAQDAYIALTTQARNPVFYREFDVPDTLDGRFELIVLHLWLQLTRWHTHRPDALKRALIEAFFQDMDQNLREFGIDTGMKKRIRAMADGYHGRITAYDAALTDAHHGPLRDALRRNVYGTVNDKPSEEILAQFVRYVREAARADATPDWPSPDISA